MAERETTLLSHLTPLYRHTWSLIFFLFNFVKSLLWTAVVNERFSTNTKYSELLPVHNCMLQLQ